MTYDITEYMTQDDIEQQLLMLSEVNIKNVNYQEFKQMFLRWKKPMNKQKTWWDLQDKGLQVIRKRLRELELIHD